MVKTHLIHLRHLSETLHRHGITHELGLLCERLLNRLTSLVLIIAYQETHHAITSIHVINSRLLNTLAVLVVNGTCWEILFTQIVCHIRYVVIEDGVYCAIQCITILRIQTTLNGFCFHEMDNGVVYFLEVLWLILNHLTHDLT